MKLQNFSFILFVPIILCGKYKKKHKNSHPNVPILYTDQNDSYGRTNIHHTSNTCIPQNQSCIFSMDCCVGTTCENRVCSAILHDHHSTQSVDEFKSVEEEMATGKQVDVRGHKNIKLLPSIEECGRSLLNKKKTGNKSLSRRKRLVGGVPYELGKYPWMVSLHLTRIDTGTHDVFQCGAALINKRFVLTAAHCATRIPAGMILKHITLGNVDRRIKLKCVGVGNSSSQNCSQDSFVDAEVEEVILHEGYSEAHVRNDIALLRLKDEIEFTDYIQPICLPLSESSFKHWPDEKLSIAGWGAQKANGKFVGEASNVAQEIDMKLVARRICDRFYSRMTGKLRKSQICLTGPLGRAECSGDSGGPSFKKIEVEGTGIERYFVFGVVSTGATDSCGRQGKPSVFTNVMAYMPWILDHLDQKPKQSSISAKWKVIPSVEFNTGLDIDVTKHRNIGLLPLDCGMIQGQINHDGPAVVTPHKIARKKRMVGGIVQSVGTFPWMAQVYVKHVISVTPDLRCGGALITSRHVLTAAHCVADIGGPFALDGVLLGNFNRLERAECIGTQCIAQVITPIEEIFVHEDFSKHARENDVAIIKLAHEVIFSRFIKPICLPLTESVVGDAWPHPEHDKTYIGAGWGRVTAYDDVTDPVYSNILIAANLTLESKKYCESTLLLNRGLMENTRVCGGASIPGRGECHGDTGGPMMKSVPSQDINGQNVTKMYAFGILSIAECAHQGVPSLYQNLVYHMPWIMEHLDK